MFCATATGMATDVQKITESLLLDTPKVLRSSLSRDNITFHREKVAASNATDPTLQEWVVKRMDGNRGLVYCASVDSTYVYQKTFEDIGRKVAVYNRNTSTDKRKTIMADFSSGTIDIIICTSALEMGFHLAGVQTMVATCPFQSYHQLLQVSGRCGRGGEPA